MRSELPFGYLRAGSGEPLQVREATEPGRSSRGEPIMHWHSVGGLPLEARLFEEDSRFAFWIEPLGWFEIDPDEPTITVPADVNPILREQRMWGVPTALCMLERGDLPIHASAVDIDGSAVLFGAPAHFGKTTLAAAFLRAGHRVLSEDLSCCRASPSPLIFPGPAGLRIRPDVFRQLDFPGTRVLEQEPHRIHLAIDEGRRGDGLPVPLRAVVLLRETKDDLLMERVPAGEAMRDVWTLVFKLPTDSARAASFEAIASLLAHVPVHNLHRPLRIDRLPDVIDLVVDTVSQDG
ncbi:MAG TPA: hypothetical protein VE915_08770 [Actinomycetota bacterium]|nr:hypothetical protein [Actinomycetota bacterium]